LPWQPLLYLIPSGPSNQIQSQNLEAKAMTDPACQKPEDTSFSCITTFAYLHKLLSETFRVFVVFQENARVIPQNDQVQNLWMRETDSREDYRCRHNLLGF
jgi:hypothetical protein